MKFHLLLHESNPTKVIYTTYPTTSGTKCEKMRADVLNSGIVGAWVPTCDERGNFTRKQCNSSARTCWCVSRLTGEMLEDTHQVGQASNFPLIRLHACSSCLSTIGS